MRRSLWMLAISLGLIVAWSVGRLQAQGDKVTFADPNHTSFTELPNAGRAGVSSAALWGDPNAGAAGTYTKFVPGWDAGLHLADGGLLRFPDNLRRHSVWRKLRSPHKPLPLLPLDVQGTVFDRHSFAAENVQKRKWFDLAKQLLSTDKPTKKLA